MNKDDIIEIIKKFPYIERGIINGESNLVFYIGNRKQTYNITKPVIAVYDIINEIHARTKNVWIHFMISAIKAGKSDIYIIHHVPWERNAYYSRKQKFIEKVYNCCISQNLVNYEEILEEEIA
jgi:hypothetical protein